jgi:hypothetical protein
MTDIEQGGRMRKAMLVAAVALALAGPGPAAHAGKDMIRLSFNGEYLPSGWTFENSYTDRAMGKLGYGVKNLFLGWMDLFLEPLEAKSEQRGFWNGVGIGVSHAVQNMLGGLVHTVTFPVTRIDLSLPDEGIHFKDPAAQPRVKGPGP